MAHPTNYPSPVAVPLPSDDELKRVIGSSYNSETTFNVVKMMAGTDDLFEATTGMVRAIFRARGVDPKLREMLTLRAAKIMNAPYEWQANSAMAANVGLSPQEIEAAASDGPVAGVHPDYVLICAATDELSLRAMLRDETLEKLLGRFGETTCRKLILIMSWFNLLSRFLNGCRVPLETTDKMGSRTSPID
jgi:4-carboxymuconolactone decarboxylase